MLKKIAIFCGGPSSEHEVSLNSASTIYKFIDKKKYELYFFYISKSSKCKLLIARDSVDLTKITANASLPKGLADLKKRNIFALLAAVHGEFGEDGKLQSLLELYGIPYSGSDVAASALCMDKFRSMLVMHSTGAICPNTSLEEISPTISKPKNMEFPVIVKPNKLGSSVGVAKATNTEELVANSMLLKKHYGLNHIIVQEYIDGTELSCGVLQTKNNKFIRIPPIEIIPKKAELFDYASKYEVGGSEEVSPPRTVSKELSEKIIDISTTAHVVLGCKTYSRSDFMLKDEKIYFLEINTLPGMTGTSLLPQEAKAIGKSYTQLLDFIIENS